MEPVTAVTAVRAQTNSAERAPTRTTHVAGAPKGLFLWNPKPFLFGPTKRNGVGPASLGEARSDRRVLAGAEAGPYGIVAERCKVRPTDEDEDHSSSSPFSALSQ